MNDLAKTVRLLCCGALMVSASGCAGVRTPGAELSSGAVAARTAEGARVEMTVRVNNPNEVPLPVRGVDYQVVVDGVGTFEMDDTPPIALPPRGSETLTLPASFADGSQDWAGRRYRLTGSLRYQPPGEVRELLTQYRVPLPTVPIEAEGRFAAASNNTQE